MKSRIPIATFLLLMMTSAIALAASLNPTVISIEGLLTPNITYVLLVVGIYGLIFELAIPGPGLGGIIGVICLMLAVFSLHALPINSWGLLSIALGILFMLTELFKPAHGFLTFLGLLMFSAGSFYMIDIKQDPSIERISLKLIIGTVGASALFFGVALKKILEAKRAIPKTGAESLIGTKGIAKSQINLEGTVFLQGELWGAISQEPIEEGSSVIVTQIQGNKIFVKKG